MSVGSGIGQEMKDDGTITVFLETKMSVNNANIIVSNSLGIDAQPTHLQITDVVVYSLDDGTLVHLSGYFEYDADTESRIDYARLSIDVQNSADIEAAKSKLENLFKTDTLSAATKKTIKP